MKRLNTVCFHLYEILERQNYGDSKKINSARRLGIGRDEKAKYRGFLEQWNRGRDIIMKATRCYTFV